MVGKKQYRPIEHPTLLLRGNSQSTGTGSACLRRNIVPTNAVIKYGVFDIDRDATSYRRTVIKPFTVDTILP